jgi:ATP-grasp domain-containing protein
MNETDLSSKESALKGPKILLTDTNRWPVVPRLMISFCRMGCNVAVLCPTPGHPVQKVSNVGHIFRYNGFAPVDSLRAAIEAFDPDMVVPSCDRSVQHLHELHAISQSEGSAGRKIAALIERSLGSPDGFPIVSSRYELLKIAQSEGILVPKMTAIENDSDLQFWNIETAPPWVIKADGTWGGHGVRIAKDATEAKRFSLEFTQRPGVAKLIRRMLLNRDRGWVLFDWNHSRRSVIAQSVINGRPANCAVVCWQGKVLAGIAVEVIKARGATGPATVVQIVSGSEMIAAAEKITRRLGISGFFGLDFMIEKGTGAVYLIEMNPRCTPPCPLPLGDGRDLVAAIWAQLTDQPVPSNQHAIERNIIAYFPQVLESADDVDHANLNNSTHCDIPLGEPELMQELLHPWSGRSIIGKLIDLIRPRQHQENASIAFSMKETQAPVGKEYTAETLA